MPVNADDARHLELQRIADFDHVFVVLDGQAWEPTHSIVPDHIRVQASSLYAPEAIDVDPNATELDGWELPLSGLTGQYGYSGPWLHDSEQIPGAVAERVLGMAGIWVAIYGRHYCQECGGEGKVWDEDMLTEDPCPLGCEPGANEIEGWTMAYRPFEPEPTR